MTIRIFPRNSGVLLVLVALAAISMTAGQGFPVGKRLYRSLPSVSDNHYSEVFADGTYKYAYTGENRYTAERRKRDGQVEGETYSLRADGVPVKVHYYADARGYRPRSEVLYSERVPAVVPSSRSYRVVPTDGVVYAAPIGSNHIRLSNRDSGNDVVIGNNGGGDVAVAQPQITAVVGPGAAVEIRPEAVARTGDSGRRYFRNGYNGYSSGGGDVAIANPSVNAIVAPGASVSIAPRATALTGSASDNTIVREIHHQPQVTRVVHETPVHVARDIVHIPVPERRLTYVPPPAVAVPVSVAAPYHPRDVVIIPPRPSYSYSYGYSSPDEKHPAYGPNSAYVNVKVNSKK